MLGLEALLLLTATANASGGPDPLSKADEGLAQCYEPNDAAKTCQSLATYRRNNDGSWDNTALVLLAPDEPLTLETVTTVYEKNGAVCGYIRKDDIAKGKLRDAGQLIPHQKAAPMLSKIAAGMAPLMNKEICTEYVQSGDDWIAKVKVDGGTATTPDQHIKWVLPSDGYAVAPAPNPYLQVIRQ
ncbi:MAG: hypothetical protein J7496_17245 [Novosphingobium sp.]|nr:hypothetical protein [Novosphingobium sp.]MBO9604247.1 hypothetical protein [Novosphingobium sp.]